MYILNAKEYLLNLKLINEDIQSRLHEREELYASLLSSPKLSDVKVQSSQQNHVENTYVKIIDISKQIDVEIDKLYQVKLEASRLIDKVANRRHKILLRERYLNNREWYEIAERMHISVSHVHTIHGQALQDFRSVYYKNVSKIVVNNNE